VLSFERLDVRAGRARRLFQSLGLLKKETGGVTLPRPARSFFEEIVDG
jgi:hypothetical protein